MKNCKGVTLGPEEFHLNFDGKLGRNFLPFCPFIIPWASVYQSMLLISMLYKDSLRLKEIMDIAGHKMNEHALEAFRQEISKNYTDIIGFKAGVEN